MTNKLENNIYETGKSFCSVTIKLIELFLYIFQIISSSLANIIFQLPMINNLFDFDISLLKAN